MAEAPDVAAPALAPRCDVVSGVTASHPLWHDIPHPIGDPDDDDELPGGDDEDDEDEDEDDEDPLQV